MAMAGLVIDEHGLQQDSAVQEGTIGYEAACCQLVAGLPHPEPTSSKFWACAYARNNSILKVCQPLTSFCGQFAAGALRGDNISEVGSKTEYLADIRGQVPC